MIPTLSVLHVALVAMILALLVPLYQAARDDNIWQIMLAFSSVSTKASVIVLSISVLRDDWMLGVFGAIVLSVGNAGFMLLANILKRMEEE
jgi:multicomponent Na+:H+ antiporter subunit F